MLTWEASWLEELWQDEAGEGGRNYGGNNRKLVCLGQGSVHLSTLEFHLSEVSWLKLPFASRSWSLPSDTPLSYCHRGLNITRNMRLFVYRCRLCKIPSALIMKVVNHLSCPQFKKKKSILWKDELSWGSVSVVWFQGILQLPGSRWPKEAGVGSLAQ